MKKLKRLLSVLITITLIFGLIAVPTFAAQSLKYEEEARVLNQLGLFKGVSATEYRPNLEAKLLREEAVALLLRMFGLEEEALKMGEKEATNVLKRFKDADEIATWAIKYIAYAVENNVIVGRPDGNFAPKDNLLGREYSKMILAMLGYVQGIDFQYEFSTSEFCSVTGFSQTEAAKLDTETILRDHVVGMSFFALTAEYAAGKNKGVTVIEAIVADDEDLKEIAINAGLIEEAVIISVETLDDIEVKVGEWLRLPSTVRAVYSDGKVADVRVDWPSVDTSKAKEKTQITGIIEGTDIVAKVNVTIKVDKLKVESVTADNLKEIYVVYNKDVSDDIEVAEKDNYKLNLSNPISGVRVDGNTAILTVTNDIDNQKPAKLTISEKILGEKVEKEFVFFDATLPEIIDMEITGPKSVNIIFSEPMKKNGKITLKSGNSTLSVNTTFKGYGTSMITVPLYSTFVDGKTYDITIRDFEDYAGYKNIIRTIEFVYEKDETPPIATVDTVRQEYVKVTFNKPVKGLTPNHFSHTFTAWKAMSLTKTDTYIDPAKEPNNENLVKPTESVKEVYAWFYHDGKKKELERPIHEGTTSFRVIAKSGDYTVKDEWGNTLEELNVSISVTADRTAPEVTEIEVISENEIKIKFSKSVEFSKDNIEVLDTNGEKIDGVRLTVVNPGTGKEFNVKLRKNLTGMAILVNIRNVEDASLYANKMAPYSEVIEIDDKTPPKVNMATYSNAKYSGTKFIEAALYVFYDEPLDADSALKVSNYYIYNGSTYTKLTGATSFFSGEKIVRIELTEGQYNKIKDIAKVTGKGLFVIGVKDIAGNEIEPRIKTIDGSQDVANIPAIKTNTVKATATDTIELVFNQELASISHNAFKVRTTDEPNTKYIVVGMNTDLDDGNTKVILTVEGEERVNGRTIAVGLPHDLEGITLDFIGDEVENLFGIEGIDKSGIAISDKIAPEVVKIAAASTDKKINITFTEKLSGTYVSMYVLDLIITDEDDEELVAGIDFTTALSPTESNILEVTIKKGGYGKYTVGSVDNPGRIADLKGNVAKAFPDAVEVKISDRSSSLIDELSAKISEAEALVKTNNKDAAENTIYTAASWNEFTTAYSTAKGMRDTTNTEIRAKINAINAAIGKLIFAGKAALDEAISAADELKATNNKDAAENTIYTETSWSEFTTAYNTAKGMPQTTNQEVIDKTNAINDAIAKLVTHLDAFNNAITNAVDGGTITLTGNVIVDEGINITKLVSLNLGTYTIKGNVNISSDAAGTINISNGTIDGDLTVNTPNATVNNSATVTGTVTINGVATGTWNENVSGNTIVVNATAPVSLNIGAGHTVGSLTLNTQTTLTIPAGSGATSPINIIAPTTIISSQPVVATIANGIKVTVKETDSGESKEIIGTGGEEPVTIETDPSIVETKEQLLSAIGNSNLGTITLAKDITLDATLAINRAVTIDGKGKTISGAFFNVTSGAVTFENIKFQGTGSSGSQDAIQVRSGATVTVTNCIFEGLYRGINAYFGSTITVQNNTFTDVYRCIIAGMGSVDGKANVVVKDISGNTFNLGFKRGETKFARGISYNTDSKQGKDTLSAAIDHMYYISVDDQLADNNKFLNVNTNGEEIDLDHKIRYYSGYQDYVNHPLANGTATTTDGGATVTVLNGTASGVIPTTGDQRELVLGKITVDSSTMTVTDLKNKLSEAEIKADFVGIITVKDSSGNTKTEETLVDGDRVYIKSKDGKETDYYIIEIKS
jgi:hypothetical protein